jgi:hypothetical protein
MTEQAQPGWDSAVVIVAVVGVCAVIGLIALPLAFGTAPLSAVTLAGWLFAAVLLSVVLLALVPRLSASMVGALDPRVGGYSEVTPSQTQLVSRLLLLGLMVVIAQAILRRPLALVISGEPSAASVEAGIAALALALVLALLMWLYQTARPMVQAFTLRAIDAAIPTVGEPLHSEPTRTTMSVVTAPTAMSQPAVQSSAMDAPTVRTSEAEPPTRPSSVADEPTLRTPPADATLPSAGVDGPTLPSTRADEPTRRIPPAEPDATLRADEPTL